MVNLIETNVARAECQRRVNHTGFWMDWDCGATTLRIGVTEFVSAEAASRMMARVTRGRSKIVPLAGVGQESGVSNWKEQRAKEWLGGAFLAFRRDTFVVTAETRIMAGGMGQDEPERAQQLAQLVAKEIDAALALRAIDSRRPR